MAVGKYPHTRRRLVAFDKPPVGRSGAYRKYNRARQCSSDELCGLLNRRCELTIGREAWEKRGAVDVDRRPLNWYATG